MSVTDLLFRFDGRISRTQFWLGHVAMAAVVAGAFLTWFIAVAMFSLGGANTLSGKSKDLANIISWFALLLTIIIAVVGTLWMTAALACKRLHDRGKSGWWALALCAMLVFAYVPKYWLVLISPALAKAVGIALGVAALWYIIELGLMKGVYASNAYGPDPMAHDATPATAGQFAGVATTPLVAAKAAEPQGFGRRNVRTA